MDKIIFEQTEPFVPDAIHLQILQAVAGKPNCPIGLVVSLLEDTTKEHRIRTSVHQLLEQQCLDSGETFSCSINLRLTSRGRILLQKAGMTQ